MRVSGLQASDTIGAAKAIHRNPQFRANRQVSGVTRIRTVALLTMMKFGAARTWRPNPVKFHVYYSPTAASGPGVDMSLKGTVILPWRELVKQSN